MKKPPGRTERAATAREPRTPPGNKERRFGFSDGLIRKGGRPETEPKRNQDPERRLLSGGVMPERQADVFAPGFQTLRTRNDPGSEKDADRKPDKPGQGFICPPGGTYAEPLFIGREATSGGGFCTGRYLPHIQNSTRGA